MDQYCHEVGLNDFNEIEPRQHLEHNQYLLSTKVLLPFLSFIQQVQCI